MGEKPFAATSNDELAVDPVIRTGQRPSRYKAAAITYQKVIPISERAVILPQFDVTGEWQDSSLRMEAAIMAIVSPKVVLHLHDKRAQQHSVAGASDRNIAMLERARAIIRQEAAALESLSNRIDENICLLVDHILSSTGIVVVCGVGKSRLVGEKISAILTSTGTRSITLDPVDALHGDLGRVRAGDVILALSNSGETAELLQLIRAVRQFSVIVAAITGRANSSLAKAADVVLDIGLMQEACALGLAPTTSTMAMAAMGRCPSVDPAGAARFHAPRFRTSSLGWKSRTGADANTRPDVAT